LYFHAIQAKKMAIAKGWVKPDWDFDKFGSEGKMEKIEAWLSNTICQNIQPGPLTMDSNSEDMH